MGSCATMKLVQIMLSAVHATGSAAALQLTTGPCVLPTAFQASRSQAPALIRCRNLFTLRLHSLRSAACQLVRHHLA